MKKITDKQIALFCGFLSLILLTIILVLMFTRTDYDCRDFKTQAKAQEVFNETKNDKFNLDGNKNGVACDVYFNSLLTPTPSKTPVKSSPGVPQAAPTKTPATAPQVNGNNNIIINNPPAPTTAPTAVPTKKPLINLPTIKLPIL